jgi:hypothetical protein
MAHTSTSPAAAPRLPNRSSSWCSALKPARAHRPGRDPAAEPLPGGTPRGTFVGEVATGRATGAPVFTLSRPRSGPDGRPDGGVLGAAFRPAEFAAFYATIAEHPGDVAALARAEDGQLYT